MAVLTDNKKIADKISDFIFVNSTDWAAYNGNPDIYVVVCSRASARQLLEIDLPNLRMVQLLSAGYDGVDIEAYKQNGVVVANAANIYSVGMAEFVVYSMLKSAKRYNERISNNRIRLCRNYKFITELNDKNVVILGVGGIGGEVAKRLSAFGMKIFGYAQHTREKQNFEKIVSDKESLKILLQTCDYLVSTLPDNENTRGFLNKEILECLKDGSTIVNVGRRKVFNESDLYLYLRKHKSVTAILDMFERIPNFITNPFRRLSNVLVLPGVTAISQEIDDKLVQLVKCNVEAVLNGKTPQYIIN